MMENAVSGPQPLSNEQVWQRLLNRCQADNECLLVLGGATVGIGYKIVRAEGRQQYAHRFAYKMYGNKLHDLQVIMHSCDKPNCIAKNHLIKGSHESNAADKVAKRRHLFGERHPKAKLTWKEVNEIRNSKGMNSQQLSNKYGVSRGTIQQIRHFQIWKG